ncbi:GCN5-related N-acetyltransferase [Croceibacterium ferulae]|uniref:GCN5-related N-acetyltransferase n=1 Tax=Croceibacterium ferulae TaxID=1854641 RepID=UPI000F87C656|nr:GCN5-related N-acetyltransferase [Croceibacterium ferulae]
MPPLAPAARAALEAEWLALVRHDLPAVAVPRGWPITLDHCFARVLLDNAVGGCWYAAIPRRPAYRHATDAQLAAAVALGRQAAAGTLDMEGANARSLAWRRARKA